MTPEETIDFHIRWAWAKLSKTYNSAAQKHGATMAMGYALLSIDKEGTLSTKLGPKMGMEPTGMTRLLRSLEEQNFVRRAQDKKDKRKVWIHLTPKGRKYRDITKEEVIRLNEHLRKHISSEDMDTFFRVIGAINSQLDKITH